MSHDKVNILQGTLALMVLRTLDGLWAAARLRHRPAYRAGQPGYSCLEPGNSLSRAAAASAGRLDQGKVGAVRNRAKGEVLQHHNRWEEAACRGGAEMAPARGCHRTVCRTLEGIAMTRVRMLLARLAAVFRKRTLEQELDEELRSADCFAAGIESLSFLNPRNPRNPWLI